MNLISLIILSFLSVNLYASLTLEEEKKYDELEGPAFIKRLVKDKKFEEVVYQFPKLDKKEKELGLFYYYLGESYYFLKKFDKSDEALERAEKYKVSKFHNSLRGRVSYELKEYKKCALYFGKVDKLNFPSQDWEQYFQCLILAKNEKVAIELALREDIDDDDFFLESQKNLINYKLITIAEDFRHKKLLKCKSPDFYLKLWHKVVDSKIIDLKILESAHLCHPKSLEITATLVKALFNEGRYHSIAFLFESLNMIEKGYIKHTAEFYKVAGRSVVADYFFLQVDEDDYFLSQSSKFLDKENYAGLFTIPYRNELVKSNKDLSYALAYSQFKYLALNDSLKSLQKQKKLNARDEQLAKLIGQCRELDWQCRP